MPPPVYSTRFISGSLPPNITWVTLYCPSGHTWVLRNIDVRTLAAGSSWVDIQAQWDDAILCRAEVIGPATSAHVETRVVLLPGDGIRIMTGPVSVSFQISGFDFLGVAASAGQLPARPAVPNLLQESP